MYIYICIHVSAKSTRRSRCTRRSFMNTTFRTLPLCLSFYVIYYTYPFLLARSPWVVSIVCAQHSCIAPWHALRATDHFKAQCWLQHIHIYIIIYVNICIYNYIYIHVYIHTHIYICTILCVYICMYMYMYVYNIFWIHAFLSVFSWHLMITAILSPLVKY